MKKIILLSAATAALSSPIYAGEMGAMSSCCTGFISVEGGYTDNSIKEFTLQAPALGVSLNANKETNGGTGRIAAGMLNMFNDDFAGTGEIGWGYYGTTNFSSDPAFVTLLGPYIAKHTIIGFDALVGLAYMQPYYSVSLKAGALIQNMYSNDSIDATAIAIESNQSGIGNLSIKQNHTAVLPEVKVGIGYNFNPNWSLTAAYSCAFGSNYAVNETVNDVGGVTIFDTNVNLQNPTLNTLLLGLQYNF